MAEQPAAATAANGVEHAPPPTPPKAAPKPPQNPVFRMMGGYCSLPESTSTGFADSKQGYPIFAFVSLLEIGLFSCQ